MYVTRIKLTSNQMEFPIWAHSFEHHTEQLQRLLRELDIPESECYQYLTEETDTLPECTFWINDGSVTIHTTFATERRLAGHEKIYRAGSVLPSYSIGLLPSCAQTTEETSTNYKFLQQQIEEYTKSAPPNALVQGSALIVVLVDDIYEEVQERDEWQE